MLATRKLARAARRHSAYTAICAAAVMAAAQYVSAANVTFTWAAAPASTSWNLTDADWSGAGTMWVNNTTASTPNAAVFNAAGTPASITVDSAISVGAITFTTSGWTLAAGTGNLQTGAATGLTMTITTVNDGGSNIDTINALIQNNSGTNTTAVAAAVASGTTLVIGVVNTYTGLTTISGTGTVQLGAGGNLGSGGLTFSAAGTLDLNGQNQSVGALNSAVAGVITNSGGGASTLTVTGAGIYAGSINTNIALTISDTSASGTMVLTGTSSYTGVTTITEGILALGGNVGVSTNGVLGNSASGIVLNSATPGNATLAAAASTNVTVSRGISLGGSGTTSSGGTLSAISAANTLEIDGAITGAGSNNTLNIGGLGTVLLTAANTYGSTTISSTGTLKLGAAGGTLGTGALSFSGAGTFDLDGRSQAVSGITSTAAGIIKDSAGLGALSVTGITGTALVINVNSAVSTTISAVIADNAGTNGVTISGTSSTGTTVLTGANTYSGVTTITGGILALGGNVGVSTNGVLGNSASGIVLNSATPGNATLAAAASTNVTVGRGISLGSGTSGSGGTLAALSAGNTLEIDGAIASVGSNNALKIGGAGIVLLTNTNNSYAGGTTITSGELSLAGDNFQIINNGPLTYMGGLLKLNTTTFSSDTAVVGGITLVTQALNTFSGGFDLNSGYTAANPFTINNAYTGTGNFIMAGSGYFRLGAGASLPGASLPIGTLSLTGSTTFDLDGHNATIGVLAGTASTIITNSVASTTSTLNITGGSSGTPFTGVIQDGNGKVGVTIATPLGGTSAGLAVSSAQTYTGPTFIDGGSGSVVLDGSSGALSLGSAVEVFNGTFTINNSGNSNTSPYNRAGNIQLDGGTISDSSSGAATNTDLVGTVTLGSGVNIFQSLAQGATFHTNFSIFALQRNTGATALINLVVASGMNAEFSIDTTDNPLTGNVAPVGNLTLGGEDTAILPYALVALTSGAGAMLKTTVNFAVNNGNVGIGQLTAAEVDGGPTLTAGHNMSLTASTATSGSISINSLIFAAANTGAVTVSGGGPSDILTVASGGILNLDTKGLATISVPTLNFGSQEGIIHGVAGSNLTITSAITGSGGLTRVGSGSGTNGVGIGNDAGVTTLVLSGNSSYTGVTTLLDGNQTTGATLDGAFTRGTIITSNNALGVGDNTVANGTVLGSASQEASLDFAGGVQYTTPELLTIVASDQVAGNFSTGTIRSSSGNNLFAGNIILASATGTSVGFNVFNTDASSSLNLTGTIMDGAVGGQGLRKSGAGTLILSGSNTYSGTSNVVNGTLLVSNTSGSATGSGNVVLNGATLGGGGTISGTVNASTGTQTIFPSATLSTTSATTLTMGGLTTGSGTTLQFNLVTPGNALNSTVSNSDAIMVTGANGLTLNGGTVNLTNHATGAASLGFYKVIAYSGTIGGTGLSSLTLPATVANVEYTFDTTHDAGFVDIHRGFAGDVDDSGFVDINDLAILAAHWQQAGGWAQGNFLGDPVVDINDLAVLAANWQTGITSFGEAADSLSGTSESFQQAVASVVFGGVSSVPEPTSLALLGMGAAGLLIRRRNRR